jgi:apolipoprotein N-acyltransferase
VPVALLVSAGSGLLLSLAFPPAELWPIAFVALVPWLWLLRRGGPGWGALLGFVFGVAFFGATLYWIFLFGALAWTALTSVSAVSTAIVGALVPGFVRPGRPIVSALAVASLWTVVDWIRGAFPLGGFTWGSLGISQVDDRVLLPLATLTGVWGVTFVVVLVDGLILAAILEVGEGSVRVARRTLGAAALLVAAAGAATLPGFVGVPAATGRSLDVAVVQGNAPRERATDFYLRSRDVAANHIRLNLQLEADPPDVAVWPENALDVDPAQDPVLRAAVEGSIRAVGAPTLAGAVTEAPGDRWYNQVLYYSPQGEVVDRYSKMHPVPFGEYVPFRRFLGWVQQLRAVPRDIAPGHEVKVFQIDGVQVGTPICFENIFPDLFRRFVAKGANLVVVTTNDSTWGDSPASREHVVMSQIRAVETGRWIVQAAISGESAVIDPRGHVVVHTPLFVPAIIRFDVPTSSARTLYVRWGDWFPRACGLSVALALAIGWRRGRRGGAAQAPPAGERRDDSRQVEAERDRLSISGGADPRTLVVLPTYNERDTIATVLAGVLAAGPNVDAFVVDDNSPDGTGEIVAAMAEQEPRVRLATRSGKLGLASAYVLGFRKALGEDYDIVVEMDADLSHRPEDLPVLLSGVSRHDVVIGSRYVPGGAVSNWSRVRVALSKGGNAYARAMLRLPVSDATSGFRAYRRHALATLLDRGIRSDGYAFQIELAYRAWQAGLDIGEVPITFREREHGRSKLSRRIVVEALLNVARWGIRDRFAGRSHRSTPAAR